MPKRKPYEDLYPLDKPRGISSNLFTVKFARERGIPKDVKVGYAGTLDVLAEGLLIVGVGRTYTKQLAELSDADKVYETRINLSGWTRSGDTEYPVNKIQNCVEPSYERVLEVLDQFTGPQMQVPHSFSAKKVNGQPAYLSARDNTSQSLTACSITIYDITLLDYTFPTMDIEVRCSKGTFIRTLATDIGQALTGGAYVERLRRTRVGDYEI